MKRLFFGMLALFCCGMLWSQTKATWSGTGKATDPYLIQSVEDFLAIDPDGSTSVSNTYSGKYFKQTVDLNLGDLGTRERSIVRVFAGNYDGDGHSIVYEGRFNGKSHLGSGLYHNDSQWWSRVNGADGAGDYGLFGVLNSGGTIRNLSVSGAILFAEVDSTDSKSMNAAMLVGHVVSGATVSNCNATGNVSTYVQASNGGGADVAVLIGQSEGTVEYCRASGNVVGTGWVGGLIGSASAGKISWCTFSGKVEALQPAGNQDGQVGKGWGGFAGGIVGFGGKDGDNAGSQVSSLKIEFCAVDADIKSSQVASGIVSSAVGGGTAAVSNCIVKGTFDGNENNSLLKDGSHSNPIGNSTNVDDSSTFHGDSLADLKTAIDIINSNRENQGDGQPEFDVVNGEIVLYPNGKPETPCLEPENLIATYNKETDALALSWIPQGVETQWEVRINGGALAGEITKTVTREAASAGTAVQEVMTNLGLTPSTSAYSVYIKAKCSDSKSSAEKTASFSIACPEVGDLKVTEKSTDGFTITWTGATTVKLEVKQGETLVATKIMALDQAAYTIGNLLPGTKYVVALSAECASEYVGTKTTAGTTDKLPVPAGLAVESTYDGEAGNGTAEVSWTDAADITEYEYEFSGSSLAEDGTYTAVATETASVQAAGFTKSGIAPGSYRIRVRSKKSISGSYFYSDWTDEVLFAVLKPGAPKNPTWDVVDNADGSVDVVVSWQKGDTEDGQQPEWKIDNTASVAYSESPSYTYTNKARGDKFTVSIVQLIGENTSAPLEFDIQIPCAAMEALVVHDITQTSAVLNNLELGDKIYLNGSTEAITAQGQSVFMRLETGTHYDVVVRRYCNEANGVYAETQKSFTTYACMKPKALACSGVESTSATVSWGRGNEDLDDLSFQVQVLKGSSLVQSHEVWSTTLSLTGLEPKTKYTVTVAEQCGEEYGETASIPFTTAETSFTAVSSGNWNNTSTWQGGLIPTGAKGTISVNEGVKLGMSAGKLIVDAEHKFVNNGTLVVGGNAQVINTGSENIGGVVEVSSIIANTNKWSFIGIPFKDCKLASIKPNGVEDVAAVLYDAPSAAWGSDWATVNNDLPTANAFFAWPFYNGTIEMTNDTDGDGTADYELNNEDISLTVSVNQGSDVMYWYPFANPYLANLSVSKFLADNASQSIQGNCVSVYNGTNFDIISGDDAAVSVAQAFFVQFTSGGEKTVELKKTQLKDYPSATQPEAKTADNRAVVTMALYDGKRAVNFYIVHNPEAENGYDVWDANKMFATTGVSEPYFVTDGEDLVKEEVKDVPYYANMNVRSQEDTLMTFIAKSVPEGYSVSIIDGEQTVDMPQGGRYTTDIHIGDNAGRFKLLLQKNVGLNEVAGSDIRISNSNRHFAISSQDKVRVFVYNTLGQKVYETTERNFTLDGVASGAYVVKVQSGEAVQSQKVIIQ